MTDKNEAAVGASELSDQLGGKPMSEKARYYCIYIALLVFGVVMSWPICWWLSIAIDDWRWFPSIFSTAVFYWMWWAGISAAKELGDKA